MLPTKFRKRNWRERSTWIDAAYDPEIRGLLLQAALFLALVFFAYEIASNAAANLKKQNIASGFAFLSRPAGFDVSQSLITYSSKSSYLRAFCVGLTNTLVVAMVAVLLASILGFVLGIARLSTNWLAARLALTYIEIVRNIPLLLQLLIWYVAVLRALPMPSEAWQLGTLGYLDKRGLHVATFDAGPTTTTLVLASLIATAAVVWLIRTQRVNPQDDQKKQRSSTAAEPALVILLAILAASLGAATASVQTTLPTLGRFNFEGGTTLEPEFMALLLALTTYTAAFIAEVVRSGLSGIKRGQWEAAAALGLSRAATLRYVIIPQAMRIIIPPLTNQYLNLTKNSSLAVAIGYPDLVSVFSGTVLNQTGQAVEVILMTMAVYLAISLATSALMGWFNRRMALVER